ncbi:MAG: exodeoxyribonuclease VII small subunit [Candidatus Obscuribacterales bacterium]|nr:exodeoxyribonuclease VII small subunit [Candidatus Obscuribacterales bacterium]
MAMTLDKGPDFEAALAELEKVVLELEGEVKLEQALALFDRGTKLSQSCEEFLKSAEQKIEILKRAASGAVTVEKFEETKDSKEPKDAKEAVTPSPKEAKGGKATNTVGTVTQTTIAGLVST